MKKFGDINVSAQEMEAALAAHADGDNYVGLGDDMLEFGDANSFINESETGKEFTMKFTNNTGATQKLQINPVLAAVDGHTLIKEGHIVTVGSGESATYLDGAGDPSSIDKLLALIAKAPQRIRAIKVDVNSEAQFSEPFKMFTSNVFATDAIKQIVPSNFQDQSTNYTKTVTFDINWVLSHRHTLLYQVRNNVEVTITFFFGAALDLDAALNAKYKRCVNTAAQMISKQ